jgi:hypothetical protein
MTKNKIILSFKKRHLNQHLVIIRIKRIFLIQFRLKNIFQTNENQLKPIENSDRIIRIFVFKMNNCIEFPELLHVSGVDSFKNRVLLLPVLQSINTNEVNIKHF